MQKTIEQIKIDFTKLKIGRLTAEMFEKYTITAYGEKTQITELCQIISKTMNTVQLNIYDESLVSAIIKILENSDLNLQIKKEGKNILCTMLGGNTKEVKQQIIKQIKAVSEKAKLVLRKQRHEALEQLKPFKKFESEDFIKNGEKEIENIHQKLINELDQLLKSKEKEINSA
ncbi:ribosome recycling factor, putative [Ichthyophthirius multifiliis]|uniref:Ribosome recycling factor, putative n=1 Tax=Ichthyophthirius multifiliis TaxID=5932 RepID=G0R3P6_ICHMU|nr:ribosome recycling factor, putative [Ichthyophthirius multifiliis]EGR27901.1 ribosome recycling factor, putative [Ichthyophthirius multifiliis]|eukprot:XP_004027246.1 ribosome recycling factor, putative [Ichthyophthirius multifiliis]